MRPIAALLLAILIAGCAGRVSRPQQVGPDTYTIKNSSRDSFRTADSMTAELNEEAARFCAAQGRKVAPGQIKAKDGALFSSPTGQMYFRCLPEGDPGLEPAKK